MGDSETEYDLDTLTAMLDSDDETTQNIEENDNKESAQENEEFENDEDLNALADLMQDDDMESTTLETNKPTETTNIVEPTNLSAAELGLELSDDEEKGPTNKSGMSSFGSAFADSKFAPQKNSFKENKVDPLEKELQEMEDRMKLLKDQLKKKKRMDSTESKPSFTKLTNVVDSPNQSARTLSQNESSNLYNKLQRGSEIHKGDTDSEDEEDNRNPFEQNYHSYGREIKQRIAHDEHKAKISVIDKTTAALDRIKRIEETISDKKTKDNDSKVSMPVPNLNSGWKNVNGSLVGLKNPIKPSNANNYEDASLDPYSGLRISNPLVSADSMRERMESRKMVRMSTITLHMRGGEIEGDWVTMGVVVDKSAVKTSQKGSQYSIWTLSDLRDCTKTVSLFLFASAHKDLWKSSIGSVIGLLNPDIMKDREGSKNKDLVSLSVNYAQKVMLMGTSKDLGWCKGTNKQQGTKCRNFVNKSSCEFCVYHIQAEYKKTTSKRADIQSSFSGVTPRQSLKQKVLGKSEVFYGGQSFNAVEPDRPKHTKANKAKDKALLGSLGSLKSKLKANELKEEDRKKLFVLKHMTEGQVQAVRELSQNNDSFTERLLAPTPGARNLIQHKNKEEVKKKEESGEIKTISAKELLKMTHRSVLQEKKKKKASEMLLLSSPSSRPKPSLFSPRPDGPQLGRGLNPGQDFDLDISFSPPTKGDMAKARAVALLKHKGGIQAVSPNAVRNKDKCSDPKFQESVRKRVLETSMESEDGNNPNKRSRLSELSSRGEESPSASPRPKLGKIDVNSEKYKAMMEKSSKHTNLITAVEDEAMDKYYNNLEKKEMLEDKMNSIMEIQTNAVACVKCKYLAESASDFCKSEQHPLKYIKTKKRFFQCKNCKRRTSSLDKLPRKACGGCQGTSWERCAMGRDKKGPKLETEILSLRGDELGHYSGSSNKVYLHI